MLVVETIARIRRDHLVRGVPIKKIARDLRVSKNTVRKVVRGDETSYSYERKLSYDKTAAGADALEDADGNEAASFTDFPVTNNSQIAPDTTPRARKARRCRVPATGSR